MVEHRLKLKSVVCPHFNRYTQLRLKFTTEMAATHPPGELIGSLTDVPRGSMKEVTLEGEGRVVLLVHVS
jgi:hypothetical protein